MKQEKVSGYRTNYPKKLLKGVALAAATVVVIGSATGCRQTQTYTLGMASVDCPTEDTFQIQSEATAEESTFES